MRDHQKLRVNAVCAPAKSCAESLASRPIEELQYVSLYQWAVVLKTMIWCCCCILEFSLQIEIPAIQFWVSRALLWLCSNFSLLTCQILFLMHALFNPLQPIRIFLVLTGVVWCSSSCDELPLLPVPCSWCPCGNREDQKHDWKGEMS